MVWKYKLSVGAKKVQSCADLWIIKTEQAIVYETVKNLYRTCCEVDNRHSQLNFAQIQAQPSSEQRWY